LRLKKIGYWTATVLLALALLLGGAAHFVGQKDAVESVVRLGYPAYFVAILGFWKVLGGIALFLVPGFPRLKEWTYAGVFFDLAGAAASHVVCRSATWHVAVPAVLAALTVSSWALRPPSRALGILFSPAPFCRKKEA
jgi:DoxX-like family